MDLEKLKVLENIANRIDSELTQLKHLIREQYELNQVRGQDMLSYIDLTNSPSKIDHENDITDGSNSKIDISEVVIQQNQHHDNEDEDNDQEFILGDNYPAEYAQQHQAQVVFHDFMSQDHQEKPTVSTSKTSTSSQDQNQPLKHLKKMKNTQNTSKARVCKYCNRSFENGIKLSNHMHRSCLIYLQSKVPYECTKANCGERFETEKDLQVHLQVPHREFNCDKCALVFMSEPAFIGHLAGVHFICCREISGCGQQFSNNEELASHRRTYHSNT